MVNDELYHSGIPGMRWGKRKAHYYIERIKSDHARTKQAKEESKKIATETKEQVHLMKRQQHDQKIIDKANIKAQSKISKHQLDAYKKEIKTNTNKKTVSEMTNDELRQKIERQQLENQLRNLTPTEKTRHEFIKSMANDVLLPAAKTSGKKFISDFIDSQTKKIIGESAQDKYDKLKKDVDIARMKNDLKNLSKTDPNEQLKTKVETARLNKEYEGYKKNDPYKEMQDVIKKSTIKKKYEEAVAYEKEKANQEPPTEKFTATADDVVGGDQSVHTDKTKSNSYDKVYDAPVDFNYKPNQAVNEILQKYSTMYLEDKRR